ncbi:MAG TPA: NAD(P)H-quinone oxidoreductase [Steroidobacteraceae bacterium]|nr:NAD(P)H-quinone oxidoreductase [Steroidobacteraceae bacterium]
MTAIRIREPGPPSVLEPVQGPVPVPDASEVLVRVFAAGINRPDVLQRQGRYPPPAGASPIPGLEVAGEIAAIGTDVRGWHVGDLVCALVVGGGYAQYVAVPAVQCLPVPPGLTLQQAATLPETFFTVWLNLFRRAGLQPGETVLVHGGASGIGTTAILLASAFGARVLTTAGTAEKCAACLALGAARAINYHTEEFVAAVRESTQGRGADVILDMVGGGYMQRNIEAAATDGRIALIAVQGGAHADIDLRQIMVKRLKIMGATLRPQSSAAKGRLAQDLLTDVWPLFADRRLAPPPIHARFALHAAAQAHALMEAGTHIGKIVLLVEHDQLASAASQR